MGLAGLLLGLSVEPGAEVGAVLAEEATTAFSEGGFDTSL